MKKIGIMGGTFDPIHFGHLIIASEVFCEYKLDKIIFMPSNKPPHKEKTFASTTDRYEMVKFAIKEDANFEVSLIEILNEDNYSYTYDTIKKLKKIYNNEVELYFIIGADWIYSLHTWHRFSDLIKEITFVITKRPNYDLKDGEKYLKDVSYKILNTPSLEISSTDIRSRIKNKKNIHYLLPSNVVKYIKDHNLYKE